MRELDDDQRRVLIDVQQTYESYREAWRHAESYRGGLTWKSAKGRDYLFRLTQRGGYGKSLGPRSAETERIFEQFHAGKQRANDRLAGLRQTLDRFAKLTRVYGLERVPRVVAEILRRLDERALLGKEMLVLGTNCLFAYEARAGVRLEPQLTASGDVDLLYDTRRKLAVAAGKLDAGGLIALLRSVDKSFEPLDTQCFRAANASRFMVDFIIAPRPMHQAEPVRFDPCDLTATGVPSLEWMVNAPRFAAIAIGQDGRPTPFVVPDPRAFAVHKAWLSTQPSRDPLKKPRDRSQAMVVAGLVEQYFLDLPFLSEHMKFLPRAVVVEQMEKFRRLDEGW